MTRLKDSPDEFKSEANNIFVSVTALIIPLLLTISLFSRPIITFLYGEKWGDASPYLSILMFAGIFILVENVNRNFIKSLGKVNKLFRYTIIKRLLGITIILMTIFIVPEYVLYAYIISSFLGYIINNYVYSKLINQSKLENLFTLFKILIPNIIYYTIMNSIIQHTTHLIIQIMIACLLFFFYVYLICPLLGFDRLSFLKFLNKK